MARAKPRGQAQPKTSRRARTQSLCRSKSQRPRAIASAAAARGAQRQEIEIETRDQAAVVRDSGMQARPRNGHLGDSWASDGRRPRRRRTVANPDLLSRRRRQLSQRGITGTPHTSRKTGSCSERSTDHRAQRVGGRRSRQGVQRDMLPLLEVTVSTNKARQTDHVLYRFGSVPPGGNPRHAADFREHSLR